MKFANWFESSRKLELKTQTEETLPLLKKSSSLAGYSSEARIILFYYLHFIVSYCAPYDCFLWKQQTARIQTVVQMNHKTFEMCENQRRSPQQLFFPFLLSVLFFPLFSKRIFALLFGLIYRIISIVITAFDGPLECFECSKWIPISVVSRKSFFSGCKIARIETEEEEEKWKKYDFWDDKLRSN